MERPNIRRAEKLAPAYNGPLKCSFTPIPADLIPYPPDDDDANEAGSRPGCIRIPPHTPGGRPSTVDTFCVHGSPTGNVTGIRGRVTCVDPPAAHPPSPTPLATPISGHREQSPPTTPPWGGV